MAYEVKILRDHLSLKSGMEWLDIPDLAILSGVNGSGKSQLLSAISKSVGAYSEDSDRREYTENGIASVSLFNSSVKKAFYSTSEFRHDTLNSSSPDDVWRQLRNTSWGYEALGTTIFNRLGIDPKEVMEWDIEEKLRRFRLGELIYDSRISRNELTKIFILYRFKEAAFRGRPETESIEEPPWMVFNSILSDVGLGKYEVIEPKEYKGSIVNYLHLSDQHSYKVGIRNRETKETVDFEYMSAGEKVALRMALWKFSEAIGGFKYDMLLLDEPDAHLHPSLARLFLEGIQKHFVANGSKVIITTHSPTTVALAPEGSLFEMHASDAKDRITKVQNRDELIAKLTDGLIMVQKASRIVFVEGKDDILLYKTIYNELVQMGELPKHPNIIFVDGDFNRERIERLIPEFRAAGLGNYFGIVDNDNNPATIEGTVSLKRYTLEHYILDPFAIYFSSLSQGNKLDLAYGLRNLNTLSGEQLQEIADKIVSFINDPRLDKSQHVDIHYAGGRTVRLPIGLTTCNKREINSLYHNKAMGLKSAVSRNDSLRASFGTTQMIPLEFLVLFKRIIGI